MSFSQRDGFRERNESSRLSFDANVGGELTDTISTRLFVGYTDLGFDVVGPLTAEEYQRDPDQTLEVDDYVGAFRELDTDRGHLAPLASFAGTRFWRMTNILSNITPQKRALNRGPWAGLETAVRDAAYELREVYVVTGPTFDPNQNAMKLPSANEQHSVPTGYFKIVADSTGRLTAFIFDQDTPRNTDYCDWITTLRSVETATGLDLFPRRTNWPTGTLAAHLGCPTASQ